MSAQVDECFILIKAQPHRSSRYFETVCCAGVGRDRRWRRQYPVPFRILDDEQQFRRWDWIRYSYVRPRDDRRVESQKVVPETLEVVGRIKQSERAGFLEPLIRQSFAEASSRHESLTLIRPKQFSVEAQLKTEKEIDAEASKHRELANQLSLFDSTAKPLKICRARFTVKWQDYDGHSRSHECDDWETSAAYNRFERLHGHSRAVEIVKEKYEHEYMNAGLAFAFSTHKRRNAEFGAENQWLLVGMVRIDEVQQGSLGF